MNPPHLCPDGQTPHHWDLGVAPNTTGVCKNCGDIREFPYVDLDNPHTRTDGTNGNYTIGKPRPNVGRPKGSGRVR